MSKDFPLITTSQYINEATNWLKTIKRGEDLAVLFFPKTDRHIRIGQLLNDTELIDRAFGNKSRYIFQRLNFDAHDAEDPDDLGYQIEEALNLLKLSDELKSFESWMKYLHAHGLTLVIILPEAEKYLNPSGKIALSALSYLISMYSPVLRVLSFFEADITHSTLMPYLPSSSVLYENIMYFPLYLESDIKVFIGMIKKQWSLTISPQEEKKIIAACGGNFWLIKEALREISTSGEWSSTSEGMQFRLRSLYNSLLPSEQSAIKRIASGDIDFNREEQLSYAYLERMRALNKQKFLIGGLKDFIYSQVDFQGDIELKDNRILVNQVPVDKLFSRKEYRVIKLLLQRKNTLVMRDDIAKAMWPHDTQKQYSDWAIDQLIARLRKRLAEISLSPKLIKVVRGKGYKLQI